MPSISFVTSLPIIIFIRAQIDPTSDWQEYEHGPGYIDLPVEYDLGIRTRLLDDEGLKTLVKEISGLSNLLYLNLSENRRISNEGIEDLRNLRELQFLNLSSVDISNQGLSHLLGLVQLRHLDLSFCNRITDIGLKALRGLPNLAYLNLQGCVKISHGGIMRIQKRGLTIRE